MTSLTTIQETPSQPESTIVFTCGSTTTINASAEKVFNIITDYKNYSQWNSWTPQFEFTDGQPLHVGSEGTLTTRMDGSSGELQIPLKIIECSSPADTTISQSSPGGSYMLAWRASYLPWWFAIAERVHVVSPGQVGDSNTCEVKQWESMSGWGAYILKYVMRVPQQLEAANLKYTKELKSFAEAAGSS